MKNPPVELRHHLLVTPIDLKHFDAKNPIILQVIPEGRHLLVTSIDWKLEEQLRLKVLLLFALSPLAGDTYGFETF